MLNYIKKNNLNIGLLGGSFDPAHKGHLKISKIAKKKFKLKYVIWAITLRNPFKKSASLNIESRIKNLKKIIKNNKFIKIEYLEKKANSKRSIDIIKFLLKRNKSLKIYFIIGADNLIRLNKWKKWKELVKLVKVIVFDREGYKSRALRSKAAKQMNKKQWIFVNFKKINISSSKIRKI